MLNSLGGFTIQGLDFINRDIIKAEKILIRTEKGLELNKGLDHYELKWTFGDKQIKYRVNGSAADQRFVYWEKLKNYEKEFKRIEKYCF